MDPLGWRRNYGRIGQFRSMDAGLPIDPSGVLADGTSFATPQQLAGIIAKDPALPRCVAQHLFTYGLGVRRAPTATSTAPSGCRDQVVRRRRSDFSQVDPGARDVRRLPQT